MNWISVEDGLPQEGKYVLAIHNRGTWNDSTDQDNVNCVVVKLIKGISMDERKLMEEGRIYTSNERWKIYKGEDEHGNNLVPYKWKQFGPDSFFGQTITHWMPLPEPPKL